MPNSSKLVIAIPMKDPTASKTRLKPHLSDMQRYDLALGLFQQTLAVIRAASCEVTVLVVTESQTISDICDAQNVSALLEIQSDGLNSAARRAADWAIGHGFERMVILPADLALLSAADIEALAEFDLPKGQILLCEATDGGTNCLMASPPNAVDFKYGAGSFQRHRRDALARGRVCHVMRKTNMRFDVDTSQDLAHPILKDVLDINWRIGA